MYISFSLFLPFSSHAFYSVYSTSDFAVYCGTYVVCLFFVFFYFASTDRTVEIVREILRLWTREIGIPLAFHATFVVDEEIKRRERVNSESRLLGLIGRILARVIDEFNGSHSEQ